MSTLQTSTSGRPDSIIVSKLPKEFLLADLKSLLQGHFANFGRILRISVTTKGNRERTAHIQFSSPEEALKALENGKTMNGYKMVITISNKPPNTQILTSVPQPTPSTLITACKTKINACDEKKPNLQSTLTNYFQKNSVTDEKKDVKQPIPTSNDIFTEAAQAHTSGKAQDRNTDKCVKLDVYQGTSSKLQAPVTLSTSKSCSSIAEKSVTRLRPTRSLWEILNCDIAHMKRGKAPTASDALACQFFTGRNHPFPLALMFGRRPGTIIMPIKSMMDSIKPGLNITDSSLEFCWNTILQSVLKNVLPKSAKAVLQESIVEKMVLEKYSQLQNEVTDEEVVSTVERLIGCEEDVLICCEEVMEAMLGLVCSEVIENAAGEELRPYKAVKRALECCFRKLTDVVIIETVHNIFPDARVDYLCEEALDDILESPIFGRHVRVVAAETLNQCRQERKTLENQTPVSSVAVSRNMVAARSSFLPSFEKKKFIENWLRTSSFSLSFDSHETGSQSSLNSSVSYSTPGTPTASSQSQESSCSLSANVSNSRLLVNASTPVLHTPIVEKQLTVSDEANRGFLVSLKRKASSIFSLSNLFKKRKCENVGN